MKAIEVLKRLSWSLTLPYGVNVRNGENLYQEIEVQGRGVYDGVARIKPDAWYIEIQAHWESSALMEDFQYPDVIAKFSDGRHLYFEIEN